MNGETEVMEPVAVPSRGSGASPCKSPWYGTYVRRLSVTKEPGKGMNVMDLYPFSNPGKYLFKCCLFQLSKKFEFSLKAFTLSHLSPSL